MSTNDGGGPTVSAPAGAPLDAGPAQGSLDADLSPGTQLRQFRVESVIGRGGMGVVYEAFDTLLHRRVALKVPQFRPGDAALRERFLREARLAAAVAHPNLCPIHEVNEANGVDYLVMPLIAGESLATVIRRQGAIPPERAAEIIAKAARGMEAAHQRGIVHRDLKPGNIMLDDRGEPIVMDFGLARSATDDEAPLTSPGAILGTPSYMSPEQASGDVGAATPPADVFSLGVILYELLTGRRPWKGAQFAEVLSQVLHATPSPPHQVQLGIDPKISQICLKAMEKNRAQRYLSCGQLAEDLEAWRRGGAVAVSETSLPTRDPKALRNRRLGTTCILLTGLILFGLFMWRWGAMDPPNVPRQPADADQFESADVQPAVHPAPVRAPFFELHVQRRDEVGAFVPLRGLGERLNPGDKVQIHLRLPAPRYVYLYWIDASGKPQRLHPADLTEQTPVSEIWDLPLNADAARQEWHVVGGAPGWETAFAAWSEQPRTAAELAFLEESRIELWSLEPGRPLRPLQRDDRSRDQGVPLVVSPLVASHDFFEIKQRHDGDVERALVGRKVASKRWSQPRSVQFLKQVHETFESFEGLVFQLAPETPEGAP